MIDSNNFDRKCLILLDAFTDRIRVELQKTAIEAIRPAVNLAVEKVIAELQPIIRTQFDDYAHKMVVEIVTREVKPLPPLAPEDC